MLGEPPKYSPVCALWKELRLEFSYTLPEINLAGPKGQMNSHDTGTQKETYKVIYEWQDAWGVYQPGSNEETNLSCALNRGHLEERFGKMETNVIEVQGFRTKGKRHIVTFRYFFI